MSDTTVMLIVYAAIWAVFILWARAEIRTSRHGGLSKDWPR